MDRSPAVNAEAGSGWNILDSLLFDSSRHIISSDDNDCPLGVSCMHFHDRSVCDQVEPPEGEPCTEHGDCPEGFVCVDYIDRAWRRWRSYSR